MFVSRIWSEVDHQATQEKQQQQSAQAGRVHVAGGHDIACHPHAEVLHQAVALASILQRALRRRADVATATSNHSRPPVVALLLPRCLDYVVSSLATLAAGAAFLPLDLQWPAQRMQPVLRSAQPDILLHNGSTAALAAAVLTAASPLPTSTSNGWHCQLLSCEAPHDQNRLKHQQQPQLQQQPLPFFCLLYTSGSTGQPVGVMCTEQGFLNRYHWMQQQQQHQQQQGQSQQQQHQQQQAHSGLVPLLPGHVVAFKTAVAFVDHLWELLAPFLSGADMLLVPDTHTEASQPLVQTSVAVVVEPQAAAAQASAAAAAKQSRVSTPAPAGGISSSNSSSISRSSALWLLQPDAFVAMLVDAKVTHLVAVPSVLELWLPALRQHSSRLSLRQLVSSGEGLTVDLASQLLDVLPAGCVLVNLYGSTEVSADATCQVVTKEQLQQHQQQQQQQSRGSWVSVGQPISNMAVAVVRPSYTDAAGGGGGVADAAAAVGTTPPATAEDGAAAAQHLLQPLPRGEVGEVVVAGVGVAAGYLPSATATAAAAAAEGAGAGVGRPLDRFQVASLHMDSTFQQQQQHPNASVAVGPGWAPQDVTAGALTWFRTGDLGCLAADGTLHILGRCSQQVKIRGVRVDLLEVEQVLRQHCDAVAEVAAAAWPHPQRPQDSVLVAYVVFKQQQGPEKQQGQQVILEQGHSAGAATTDTTLDWQQQLRQLAAAILPAAARPAAYVLLDSLPRSPAGKVLRSQLPQPSSNTLLQPQQQRGPNSHSEVAVMRAMLAAVPTLLINNSSGPTAATAAAGPAVSPLPPEPTQDFFTALGGDSLAAAAVAAALGIDVRLVYAYPTARSLSAYLVRQQQQLQGSAGEANLTAVAAQKAAQLGSLHDGTVVADPQHQQMLLLPATRGLEGQQAAEAAAAKRPRLLQPLPSEAEGAQDQQQQPQLVRSSVADMLSAAALAVMVGAGSRIRAWKLPPAQQPVQSQAVAARGVEVSALRPPWDQEQQQSQQQQQTQPQLKLQHQWHVSMGRCVDAAPLLLALFRPAAAAAAAPVHTTQQASPAAAAGAGAGALAQQQLVGLLAFACSHSGTVKCMDVATGAQCWTASLPSRADMGLCLSPCATRLAVPAGDSRLYCLSTADGSKMGAVDCRSEVRAPPAIDPWVGLWWVVTHGRELVMVQPDSLQVVGRLALPAAGSAAITFSCCCPAVGASAASASAGASHAQPQQPQQPQRLALAGLLNGDLLAVSVTPLASYETAGAAGAAGSLQLTVLWRAKASAPIFSSPVVVDGAADKRLQQQQQQQQQKVVVAAAVDGVVMGVGLQSGQQLWRVQLQGQVFADLLPLQPPLTAAGGGGGVVLVATKAGHVVGLDSLSGGRVFGEVLSLDASSGGFSAAPATVISWHELQQLASRCGAGHVQACQGNGGCSSSVVLCSTSGNLHLLQLQLAGSNSSSSTVVDCVALPGEVFSAPVAVWPWVLLGCRDDNLYCCCCMVNE